MSTQSIKLIKIGIYLFIFCCSGIGYYVGAKRLLPGLLPKPDALEFARQTLINHQGFVHKALFTPNDDVKTVLLGLIQAETKHISVAIFMFTEPEISKALVDAYARGVEVEIVADRSCAQTQWSKLQPLAQAGIPIYIWPPALEATRAIMHNKFIIFTATLGNRSLLWTGSYNFTKAASTMNQENALVLEDDNLILSYLAQFEHLKEISELVGAAKLPEPIKGKRRKRNLEFTCAEA